jgi:hypothetical protein
MKQSKLWLLVPIGLILFFCLSIAPTHAEGSGASLQFRNAVFDPLKGMPNYPPQLTLSAVQQAGMTTRVVQFTGPVEARWKTALENLGVVFGPYIPKNSFIIQIPVSQRAAMEALPFVRWCGGLEPALKLSPDIDLDSPPDSDIPYRISLLPWHEALGSLAALQHLAPDAAVSNNAVLARLTSDQVITAAHLEGVLWIEPLSRKQFLNDQAGGVIMNGAAAWSAGFTGGGISVGAVDSGLDTGGASPTHPDFGGGRILNISSYPVYNYDFEGCGSPVNLDTNDGPADLDTGHGTHVMGSMAGSGAASSGAYQGLAPQAIIHFQAMEQFVQWPSGCTPASGYYPMFPAFLNMPLEEAYSWGVRIHNNSWGGAGYGIYDSDAVDYDTFAHDNPNFLITVAAGNEGIDLNADGRVDPDSLLSPGTAKNVLTLGASESVPNPLAGWTAFTWGSWGIFPANPILTDLTSSSPMEMAAISSIGPTDDGRIKPDLVAPGSNIISAKATLASGTGWGTHPTNSSYMYNGGSSMSSALAAGAAALVRQYYIQKENLTDPSGALIKATLINTAVDISGYGNPSVEAGQPIPNMHEGWGRIELGAATFGGQRIFFDQPAALNTGETFTWILDIGPSIPFKVTLAWYDEPAAPLAVTTLVNNLDLTVTDPSGITYQGNVFSGGWSQTGGSADAVNTVENVFLFAPAPGPYTITVSGANIPLGSQNFALVIEGEFLQPTRQVYLPAIINSGTPSPSPDPIQDGGFEAGISPWWQHEKQYTALISATVPTHSGSKAVHFTGALTAHSFVSQPLTIPWDRPFLHFWYSVNSTDPLCGLGGTRVHIFLDSIPLDTINVCSPGNTPYIERVIDLTPFTGAPIRTIRFEVEANGNPNSHFYLDDVSFELTP